MRRSARLSRILACAAVPVVLVAAGCSSDSDKDAKGTKDGAASASSSDGSAKKESAPAVAPAKYTKLPVACKVVAAKTVDELVPKAASKSGTPGTSKDLMSRASCRWNGLVDKGVDGSQYRWLDVSLLRYDSDAALGSGEKRAQQNFAKELSKAQATQGAKNVKTAPVAGLGSQASVVTYDLERGASFRYATVVTRTENAVVTLSYNGAGYAGADSPKGSDVLADAQKAAKEAVAAVVAANK
ncbi:DUF3558 domain-containing protein [Streptomyces sp. NPDC001941]|uniref:DUF3558 domain-containing protein n=1 Tax=Streptomyces sp. NPDC001941 TaxID=3154659 RepID=UPI003332DD54